MKSEPKPWRERLKKDGEVIVRPPLKREIAEYLGISAQAFSKYIRRGCPSDSFEAAAAWQKRYVDPTQRMFNSRAYRERQERVRAVWQSKK